MYKLEKNELLNLKRFNLSVLVVEDSKLFRVMITDILSRYFNHIDNAENGRDAYTMFKHKKYDLIITDVVMPVMNGIELVAEIRKTEFALPILVMSGISDSDRVIDLINVGVSAFIIKPIDIENLEDQLARVCKPIIEIKKSQKSLDNYISLVDKNVETSTTNLEGVITHVSDAFCKISQYTKDELLGQTHSIIRHQDTSSEIFKALWTTIAAGKIWQGEIKNRSKDGSEYWTDTTVSPIYDDDGEKIGYTAIRHNITDKKKIEEMSITDGMTGIFNRRHFNELVGKLLSSSKRNKKHFAFILLDVDCFKQYNDTYGHIKGDEALINIANIMKNIFKRGDDYCFRLGGEEFGVIFIDVEPKKALQLSNSLKEAIEALQIEHKNNTASAYITVSIGLVVKSSDDTSTDGKIYKEADTLLYQAKNSGRNRVCSNVCLSK